MKTATILLFTAAFCVGFTANSAFAQSTAFTYQGRLNATGQAVNGNYDFRFRLAADSFGNNYVSNTILTNGIPAINGVFTTTIDFGVGVFTGTNLWLELSVRTNGNGSYTVLDPLQPLTPTPYAIFATTANTLLGPLPAGQLTGTLSPSVLAGYSGSVTFTNLANKFSGMFAGDGAGLINLSMPASNLTGLITIAQLPGTLLTNNQSGVNLNGSFNGNGTGLTNVPGSRLAWQAVAGTNVQAVVNTGYLLTNSQPVSLMLPLSPSIGDIVRVSGVGPGGWRILQNASQSILSAYFANINGLSLNWSPTTVPTPNMNCVACSADGSKIVAVGDGTIYTSTNSGVTWTQPTVPGTNTFFKAASSADGTKLVAVSGGAPSLSGPIYISTNSGVTWTSTASPQRNWLSVASSANGNKLAAIGDGSIYVSVDSGATWTPAGAGSSYYSIATSTDGATIIAGTLYGSISTSTNSGSSWGSSGALSTNFISVACSSDGTKLVGAVFNGPIFTSPNSGVTWIKTVAPPDVFWAIASSADGRKLVAVTDNGPIYMSTDSGGSWIGVGAPQRTWRSVTSSADGSKFVAVGSSAVYIGQPNPSTTTTATTGYLAGGQNTAVELQYIGNGQFMPLSYVGTIFAY
jgi:hypothetical protein